MTNKIKRVTKRNLKGKVLYIKEYNELDQLIYKKNKKGDSQWITYDDGGRVLTKKYSKLLPSGKPREEEYRYNIKGELCYVYDNSRNLEQISAPGIRGKIEYSICDKGKFDITQEKCVNGDIMNVFISTYVICKFNIYGDIIYKKYKSNDKHDIYAYDNNGNLLREATIKNNIIVKEKHYDYNGNVIYNKTDSGAITHRIYNKNNDIISELKYTASGVLMSKCSMVKEVSYVDDSKATKFYTNKPDDIVSEAVTSKCSVNIDDGEKEYAAIEERIIEERKSNAIIVNNDCIIQDIPTSNNCTSVHPGENISHIVYISDNNNKTNMFLYYTDGNSESIDASEAILEQVKDVSDTCDNMTIDESDIYNIKCDEDYIITLDTFSMYDNVGKHIKDCYDIDGPLQLIELFKEKPNTFDEDDKLSENIDVEYYYVITINNKDKRFKKKIIYTKDSWCEPLDEHSMYTICVKYGIILKDEFNQSNTGKSFDSCYNIELWAN